MMNLKYEYGNFPNESLGQETDCLFGTECTDTDLATNTLCLPQTDLGPPDVDWHEGDNTLSVKKQSVKK